MAAGTLVTMREAGLTEDREIQLDFFFDAPNEGAAKWGWRKPRKQGLPFSFSHTGSWRSSLGRRR